MSLVLYDYLPSGNGYKCRLVLKALGMPYELKEMNIVAGATRTPEYLAINRFGQVPALVDGDLKLCQSGAILLYLADKYGKMGGKTAEDKARVREWIFWEFDRLAANIYRPRAIKRGFMKAEDSVYTMYCNMAGDALKVLDAALASSPFLVGSDVTMADVAVYGDVAYAEEAAIDISSFANIKAWMGRMEKLPGFKKYEDALPKQDAA